MGQTTFANGRGIAHKGSNGLSTVFPDLCKTPVPIVGVVPIPYPNIGMASDTKKGAKKVKTDKKMPMIKSAKYSKSSGDEAGVQKGVISSKTMEECEFMLYSFDVKFENKGVCRMGDPMFHNKKNIMG